MRTCVLKEQEVSDTLSCGVLTEQFAYLMLQISCSVGLSSFCLQFCAPAAIANSCPCRGGNEEFLEEELECCCCCVLQFILLQS